MNFGTNKRCAERRGRPTDRRNDIAYTTKSSDTWDVIAKQVYGSEYHADILMAANPQQIDTFLFEAGVVLATPVLEEERDGLLPPWKYEASYE